MRAGPELKARADGVRKTKAGQQTNAEWTNLLDTDDQNVKDRPTQPISNAKT